MTSPKCATAQWCESCEAPMSPTGLIPVGQASPEERREYVHIGEWLSVDRPARRDSSLCRSCFNILNFEGDTN
jgi:hypothetical protein